AQSQGFFGKAFRRAALSGLLFAFADCARSHAILHWLSGIKGSGKTKRLVSNFGSSGRNFSNPSRHSLLARPNCTPKSGKERSSMRRGARLFSCILALLTNEKQSPKCFGTMAFFMGKGQT